MSNDNIERQPALFDDFVVGESYLSTVAQAATFDPGALERALARLREADARHPGRLELNLECLQAFIDFVHRVQAAASKAAETAAAKGVAHAR